jgi:hypothetical protein
MARQRRNQKRSTDLPGTIYLNKNRYWWKVRLPGEGKIKALRLKPVGSRYATTDYAVAVECARQMLQQHLFKKDVPFQGEVRTIPDLVRAYSGSAQNVTNPFAAAVPKFGTPITQKPHFQPVINGCSNVPKVSYCFLYVYFIHLYHPLLIFYSSIKSFLLKNMEHWNKRLFW